jgi:hypothetical protein
VEQERLNPIYQVHELHVAHQRLNSDIHVAKKQ